MLKFNNQDRKEYLAASIITALLYAIGAHYFYNESTISLLPAVVLLMIRVAIAGVISLFVFELLNKLFEGRFLIQKSRKTHKYSSLKFFCVFICCWMPLLVIKYPGAMCWDTWQMLNQYRTESITTHHSVFYTAVMGRLIKATEVNGNSNIGLFVFVLIHLIVLAAAFAYSSEVMLKLGANPGVVRVISMLFIINPYVIAYIGVAMKDVLYTALIVFLTAAIIDAEKDPEGFYNSRCKISMMITTTVLCCLVRKNGIYVATFLLIIAIIKTIRKEQKKRYIAVFLLSIILAFALSAGLNAYYKAEPSSVSEALSVPFQQTARYVKEYKEEVTIQERDSINRVLDYENLPGLYNPKKSDYVKGTYKEDAKYLPAYFRTWIAQFVKHPKCYFSAYCEMYFYLFVPEANADNIVLYRDDNIGYEVSKVINIKESTSFYEDLFSPPKELEPLKDWIIRITASLHHNYVIGAIANISVNVYALLFLVAKLMIDKRTFILPFSPAIVALCFAMLGPAVYGHPRYLFPIVYSLPILLVYSASLYTDNNYSRT